MVEAHGEPNRPAPPQMQSEKDYQKFFERHRKRIPAPQRNEIVGAS